MVMAKVVLYDTTLRDGTQGEGVSFSVEDKLKIVRRLDRLGIPYIEGGWPGSNPKDMEFFQRIKDLTLRQAKVTAFCSTRRANVTAEEDRNLQAVVQSGVKTCALFGKTWDFHVTNALCTTLEENLKMIEESVAYLKAKGLEVFYDAEHFFDGYTHNPGYALATLQAASRGGADVLVLCDTNGGRLPHEIVQIINDVKNKVDKPLGIHAHNDSGVAVANTLAAVREGVRHVQGTINGYGERSGNADLCSIIPNLQLKMGLNCVLEEELRQLTGVARYVSELANLSLPWNQPFVGKSVFAHKGGIHVSALMRHPETYEHIKPEQVGNRRRVLISELSGGSNVLYKSQEYDLDIDEHGMRGIVETIKDLEYQGYSFEGAEGSFELMLKKSLGLHEKFFDFEGFRLIIEKKEANGEPVAEASIKLRVDDRVLHTVAEGNGPVNALDKALRKALEEVYPYLRDIQLTDYKVRVINEKAGTGAKVRVLIESQDGRSSWGSVGVSTNIIEASWQALVDSIEYGLSKQKHIRGEA
jgi:2-isopropylmalate synthase